MTRRYKRAVLPTITHPGQGAMRTEAKLEMASTGDLIRELRDRGYRTFLAARVKENEAGWVIPVTRWERKRKL
jgi:hypothetical protein